MIKKTCRSALIIVFGLVLFLQATVLPSFAAGKELSEGDKAPDFTTTLVNGKTFKLSKYKNKIVLLNFWATWCPPCVGEMPAFQKLSDEKIKNVVVIAVDCMEDEYDVDEFAEDNGYTFNIGYDTEGDIEAKYPTSGIPYTLVINHGVIDKIFIGARDADYQYNEYKKAIQECKKKNKKK